MNTGDLVHHATLGYGVCLRCDPFRTQTALVLWNTGRRTNLPCGDTPEVRVVAHPATQWAHVVLPECRVFGPIHHLDWVQPRGLPTQRLDAWVHWMLSDPTLTGGPLFLHPDIALRVGDTLTIVHHRGTRSWVVRTLPQTFAQQEQARAKEKEAKEAQSRATNVYTKALYGD